MELQFPHLRCFVSKISKKMLQIQMNAGESTYCLDLKAPLSVVWIFGKARLFAVYQSAFQTMCLLVLFHAADLNSVYWNLPWNFCFGYFFFHLNECTILHWSNMVKSKQIKIYLEQDGPRHLSHLKKMSKWKLNAMVYVWIMGNVWAFHLHTISGNLI